MATLDSGTDSFTTRSGELVSVPLFGYDGALAQNPEVGFRAEF